MKASILIATLASAILVSAHGSIIKITIGGTEFPGNNPNSGNKDPKRIVWDYDDIKPVESKDLETNQITCARGAKPVTSFGKGKAGDNVEINWTKWSESHRGPTMTYLARLPDGDASAVDPTTLTYYKIHHLGLLSSDGAKGRWASDLMRENSMTVKLRIPPSIPSGKYVLRHELLALHGAQKNGQAQFYPICANLEIEGNDGGKLEGDGVKFPGAYKASDPGIEINIHKGVKEYVIPGPAPIEGGAVSEKRVVRGINWIGRGVEN